MAGEKNYVHGVDVLTMLNRDIVNEIDSMPLFPGDSLLARGVDSRDVKEVIGKCAKMDFKHVQAGRACRRVGRHPGRDADEPDE